MTDKNAMLSELKSFAGSLPRDRVSPKIFKAVERIAKTFTEKCTNSAYFIECVAGELEPMLSMCMDKIFSDEFFCVCAFVGGNVPVESINRVRNICVDAHFCEILPTESTGSTIRIYICYMRPEFCKILDPNYVLRLFFK